MKTMKKGSLLLALLLLVGVFCGLLVSCDTDSRTLVPFTGSSDKSGSSTPYVTNVKIEGGNIIVCYSNGSCVNIGSSVTNVTESKLGDVTINGSEGGRDADRCFPGTSQYRAGHLPVYQDGLLSGGTLRESI